MKNWEEHRYQPSKRHWPAITRVLGIDLDADGQVVDPAPQEAPTATDPTLRPQPDTTDELSDWLRAVPDMLLASELLRRLERRRGEWHDQGNVEPIDPFVVRGLSFNDSSESGEDSGGG